MDKIRKILAGIFIGVIVIIFILTILFKDTLFMTYVNLTYPDGCTEEYKNAKLISNECIIGRMMINNSRQMYNSRINPTFDINFT